LQKKYFYAILLFVQFYSFTSFLLIDNDGGRVDNAESGIWWLRSFISKHGTPATLHFLFIFCSDLKNMHV